jgi:hypothetical protein
MAGFGQKYILGPTTKLHKLECGVSIQFNDMSQDWLIMGMLHSETDAPIKVGRGTNESDEKYKNYAYELAEKVVYFNRMNKDKDRLMFLAAYKLAKKAKEKSVENLNNLQFQELINLQYKKLLNNDNKY